MSHTITIRLTPELDLWLDALAKKTGLPKGRFIREQLERVRAASKDQRFMRLAGTVTGPSDLSKRKGFSRP
jgi:predicted DNA-binding protein